MPHGSSSGNGTNKGDGDKMLAPKRISTSTLVLPNTGPTAKDYIQDGLVAMWDGIENAGWGVHDGEATTWKDLVGGGNITWTSYPSIAPTSPWGILHTGAGSGYAQADAQAIAAVVAAYKNGEITAEYVARFKPTSSADGFVRFERAGYAQGLAAHSLASSSYPDMGILYVRDSATSTFKTFSPPTYKPTFYAAQTISLTDRSSVKFCNGTALSTTIASGVVLDDITFSRLSIGLTGNGTACGALRIYNRALSPEEITYNYSIDNKRFNLDGNFPKRNKLVSLKLVTKPITAKDYIQDGLITMWDGIENAGWGVHDPNATVWKDLTGNEHTATLTDKGHFETNCLDKVVDGAGAVAEMFSWSFVEIVFSSTTGTRNSLILFASSGTTGKIIWASGYLGQTYGKAFPIASLSSTMYYATEIGSVNNSYYNGLEVENTGSVQAWGGRSKIYIGGRDDNANSDPGKYYALRFYNRVLSPEEIAHNYSIDQVRFEFPSDQPIPQKKRMVGLYLVPPPLNPYIEDGLITMWDGIWNAGFGIHDESATIWKDLIGEKNVTLSPNGSFSENALVCSGAGYAASDGSTFTKEDIKTIEIVFDGERASSGILMVASGYNVNRSQIVSIGGNYLFTMNVSSSTAGLKNRCPIPSSGKVSASLLYSDTDFVKSVVNGTEASVSYSFRSMACGVICFGGRSQNTDVPFSGSIFSVRLYNRLLSDEEIAQNYSVDQRRFNIP